MTQGMLGWMVAAVLGSHASAAEIDAAAARGRAALLEQSHIEGIWPREAYDNAWSLWGGGAKPSDYDAAFRARYGLHPAPYENDGLPMGLRAAPRGGRGGVAIDCMLCHGGSILGTSYVGLGNTTLDLAALFAEMPAAGGGKPFPWPFPLALTRGTTNAGAVAAFVLGFRNPDLTPRLIPRNLGWAKMPDLDAPAWWLWKRKKTIYYDGGTDAQSTRATMQFLVGSASPEKIRALEPTWEDVRAFLWTLEPPRYPLPIDSALACEGEAVFTANCVRCHGTYGPGGSYPNKIVPIDTIGTDRARYDSISKAFREYYDSSWFAEKYSTLDSVGYQAPPLDGVWATAPYLHNGSVPTLYGVLQSSARPARFRRGESTDADAYDARHVGWKVQLVVEPAPAAGLPEIEARRIYDTSQYGKGNQGHRFGDHLSEAERMALLEYLKTL